MGLKFIVNSLIRLGDNGTQVSATNNALMRYTKHKPSKMITAL